MSKLITAAKAAGNNRRSIKPPPGKPQGVNLTAGKCAAMGQFCGLEHLQCARHKCVTCKKTHHAIEPCGFEEADGSFICGMCKSQASMEAHNQKQKQQWKDSEEAMKKRAATAEALKKKTAATAVYKKQSQSIKDDLIGRKLHREGRVAEAAMKDKGIISGEISDPEVITGDSNSADDSDISFGGFPPLPKNPPMPGDVDAGDEQHEEYTTKKGPCPALGAFCSAPNSEYLLGDKFYSCCLPAHFKYCSSKVDSHTDGQGSKWLMCTTCKEVGSDSADEREAAAKAAAAAPKKRDPNFRSLEDKYLAMAWGCCSEDSRRGSCQKAEEFDQAVCDAFNELVLKYNQAMERTHKKQKYSQVGIHPNRGMLPWPRTVTSVKNRWNTLKAACSKWAGVEKTLPKPSSGDTDGELLFQNRNKLWKTRMDCKKDFPHQDAYAILRDLPKWQEMDEDKDKAGVGSQPAKKKTRKGKAARPVLK